MSSEHPPEELELGRPVGYTCIHCEGWGCTRCCTPLGLEGRLRLAQRQRDELDVECTRKALQLKTLRDAAAARVRYGHNDTCGEELGPYPCSCGHAELATALEVARG